MDVTCLKLMHRFKPNLPWIHHRQLVRPAITAWQVVDCLHFIPAMQRCGTCCLWHLLSLGCLYDVQNTVYRLVECEPDVARWPLQEADSFAVLASDGLWDVMSDQEAVDHIQVILLDFADSTHSPWLSLRVLLC